MVALLEGLRRHLPVARQAEGRIEAEAHLAVLVGRERLGRGPQVLDQGFGIHVHVDEDEPFPGIATGFTQMKIVVVHRAATLPVVTIKHPRD
ncbi:hypothetical protein D3C78_1086180 [compost metagenome]